MNFAHAALSGPVRSRRRLAGEEWRLVEWPKGEGEPAKYSRSTLPADISRT